MLESDEVDEDYFTPVASTSLASIFGNKFQNDSIAENDSLKYTSPKQNIKKTEESKTSQCIFACALLVYEWSQSGYISKGKLGFAIMNIIKNNLYNIVLYDSNKKTISCTIVTPKLIVTINEQRYLSYYDNTHRYWSIYGNEEETNKIIDFLKTFGVTIQYSSQADKGPPELPKTEEIPKILDTTDSMPKVIESDTDSSLNKRTKQSLLNRMATMGHSVLPPRTIVTAKTSDSSDTNDTYDHPKIRHKPVKNVMKKNSIEKNVYNEHNVVENQQKVAILHKPELSENNIPPLYTYVNSQLVPMTNTNVITSANNRVSNDLDFFISEQRVSSSELRINMNRITDKVDHILDKVNNLQQMDKSTITSNFQTEILLKLVKEYESKIKRYEDLLSSQYPTTSFDTIEISKDNEHEMTVLKKKIEDLEAILQIKNIEIDKLNQEIKTLKESHSEEHRRKLDEEKDIHRQMKHLEETIVSKNDKIVALMQQTQNNSVLSNSEVSDRIKKIMNETYRAVSANFENDEMYSGENVRSLIALIIKKITMDSLNDV